MQPSLNFYEITSKRMRLVSHVAVMGRIINTYERTPLLRPRSTWKKTITTGIKEIGYKGVDRILHYL